MGKRKNRKTDEDNEEMTYEKKPRVLPHDEDANKKSLLPIKLEDGTFVPQFLEMKNADNEEAGMEGEESETEMQVEEEQSKRKKIDFPKSVREIAVRRKRIIAEKKKEMAELAGSIMQDPEDDLKKIKNLKELRMMIEDHESPECCATIRKLALASTTKVLVDILPGWRIRERTDEEKDVRLAKETKKQLDYEEGLLRNYQAYLKTIEKIIKHRNNPTETKLMSMEAQKNLGKLAIKCLADIYTSTTYFNFHNNVTALFVHCAHGDRDEEVRESCCQAIKSLFRTDKKGYATLETVKNIWKLVKDSPAYRTKPEILNVLLSLRIMKVDYSMMTNSKNKQKKKEEREAKKKMSRREKKRMKKEAQLKSELKEASAVEDKEERTKFHTETIHHVFGTYFRILKMKKGQFKNLLPSVLKGVSEFAHLISVEFFSDLLAALRNVVETANLSTGESLHCISAAFKVLSGQGEVLNIDPIKFYNLTYQLLYDVTNESKPHKLEEDVRVLIDCLEVMMSKRRKQITLDCLCAFIKRLMSSAMQVGSVNAARILLGEAKKLMATNSKTNLLYHVDSQDIGIYKGDEEDPEHCGAKSSCAWDLHLLNRSITPAICSQATSMLQEAKSRNL